MKKQALIFYFILIIILTETMLLFCLGKPKQESDPAQFQYQYSDIYKRFFRKEDKLFIPQRPHNNAANFLVVKPDDTIRIFIVGGSAAYNFGYFDFKRMLKAASPDKNFEVICCGMGGYDSYRDILVEKEVLSYNPDLIVVFSGNNEFYDQVRMNLGVYYVNKFLRRLWIYRSLQDKFLQFANKSNFVRHRSRENKLSDFNSNMRIICRLARAKKVPIILCTLPANFSDYPPYGKTPIDEHFIFGQLLFDNGRYQEAIREYRAFLEDDPNNAYGFYFLGQVYQTVKDYAKAKENYLKALDLDFGSGGRSSVQSNNIIRNVCREENVYLADLEWEFIKISQNALFGFDYFTDNCHWYFDYNPLVGKIIINTMIDNKILGAFSRDSDTYKQRINLANFVPPVLNKAEENNWIEEVLITNAVWRVFDFPQGINERAISSFYLLYLKNPEHLWRVTNVKEKIEKIILGNFWTKDYVTNFDGNWARVLAHIGETYRRLKIFERAILCFTKSISLNDKEPYSYLGCALAYFSSGDKRKGLVYFNKARELLNKPEAKYYQDILHKLYNI